MGAVPLDPFAFRASARLDLGLVAACLPEKIVKSSVRFGDFGKDTQEAVRRFQADKKLTVDGIAGSETLAVFKKQYAVATVQCRAGGTALTAQGLLWMSTTA